MTRPHPSQLAIPFGAQHAEARSTLVNALGRLELDYRLRELVLYVHDVARGDGRLVRTYNQLAARFDCSRSAAIRLVGRALERELIVKVELRYVSGGQRANELAINWAEVRSLAGLGSPAAVDATPPSRDATPQSRDATPPSRDATPYKEYNPSNNPSNNPSTTWAGVGDILRGHGIAAADACVEAARRAEVTPEHVAALVSFYDERRPAWGPGALYQRIRRATPGEDARDPATWPRADPEALAAARLRHDKHEQRRRDESAALARQASAAEQARLAALELVHGPALDALDRLELLDLVDQAFGVEATAWRRQVTGAGRPRQVLRDALLEHLAAPDHPVT